MAYELDKKRRCNGKVVKKEREGRKLDEDHQRAVEAHALVLVLVDACCIGQGAFSGGGRYGVWSHQTQWVCNGSHKAGKLRYGMVRVYKPQSGEVRLGNVEEAAY